MKKIYYAQSEIDSEHYILFDNKESIFVNKKAFLQIKSKSIYDEDLKNLLKLKFGVVYIEIDEKKITHTQEKLYKENLKKRCFKSFTSISLRYLDQFKKPELFNVIKTKTTEAYFFKSENKKYILKLYKTSIRKKMNIIKYLSSHVSSPEIINFGENFLIEKYIPITSLDISPEDLEDQIKKLHSIEISQNEQTIYDIIEQECINTPHSTNKKPLFEVITKLKNINNKNALLHLDIHKDNIISSNDRTYLIDFMNFSYGDIDLEYFICFLNLKDAFWLTKIKNKEKLKLFEEMINYYDIYKRKCRRISHPIKIVSEIDLKYCKKLNILKNIIEQELSKEKIIVLKNIPEDILSLKIMGSVMASFKKEIRENRFFFSETSFSHLKKILSLEDSLHYSSKNKIFIEKENDYENYFLQEYEKNKNLIRYEQHLPVKKFLKNIPYSYITFPLEEGTNRFVFYSYILNENLLRFIEKEIGKKLLEKELGKNYFKKNQNIINKIAYGEKLKKNQLFRKSLYIIFEKKHNISILSLDIYSHKIEKKYYYSSMFNIHITPKSLESIFYGKKCTKVYINNDILKKIEFHISQFNEKEILILKKENIISEGTDIIAIHLNKNNSITNTISYLEHKNFRKKFT